MQNHQQLCFRTLAWEGNPSIKPPAKKVDTKLVKLMIFLFFGGGCIYSRNDDESYGLF